MQSESLPSEPPDASAAAAAADRDRQIARTGTGIVLLMVAVLLFWIPMIEYRGSVPGAIGAILVLLRSPAFGRWHVRLVWAASRACSISDSSVWTIRMADVPCWMF